MSFGRIGLLGFVLFLCACGEELPRPEATPLLAPLEVQQSLYKFGRGPWTLAVAPELFIEQDPGEGGLRFNVYYPEHIKEPVPVLLFSHGNWSNPNQYDELFGHWVSHGYAVIAPLHMDAEGGYLRGTLNMIRYGNLGLIQARVEDLKTLLDGLEQVQGMLPADSVQFDHERIAATGHSFGAFNAQQLGGARAWDEDAEVYVPSSDSRIRAVLAISPPGPMFDEINEGSWREQRLPTLMTTGTWDSNAMFWPDWRAHLLSYETASPGDQYSLVVQGADHYLGNLICRRELEETPQIDALNMVNTAAVAFLDAYLKGNPEAMELLNSSQMQSITDSFAILKKR